ncbi:MAG: response regulator [Deltaproteobacteria bacterium]|nr:response regulator [Deltaproteobacteria bacterium]
MIRAKRVLLVENDAGLLRAFNAFLTLKGYHVTVAANGLSAIKRLKEQKGCFSLMITEMIIPDISGSGIISIVKKKYPRIAVIALTEKIDVLEQMAKEFRADVILKKPIKPVEFGEVIDRMFGCRPAKPYDCNNRKKFRPPAAVS